MKVFILEDDPTLRFTLREIMEGIGHTVFTAGNINAALEVLERVTPDLLLLDLMIGEQSSTQIADLAGYRFPQSEVVYITGSNDYPNGELFSLFPNTSRVLRKPVDVRELMAVTDHLARAHPEAVMSVS